MVSAAASGPRAVVDGRFFRLGADKFHLKGVAYCPLAPNEHGEPFGTRERTTADLAMLQQLGANLVRVYSTPPRWFLDAALDHGLRVLVDAAWNKHACFLDDQSAIENARKAVLGAAEACHSHPAIFGISLVNEIPPDVVRWSGPARIEDFIDELAVLVRAVDPDCLRTFGNYPPTEFLRPREVDFVCFNVYLHSPLAFRNYLARLQLLAETKPLVLGEFGLDSNREGEERQAEFLTWQTETAFRSGLAGAIVYSFTDEWHKDGRSVEDWRFGLTLEDRRPKPAFAAVQCVFAAAPHFPPAAAPRVSVVVACYNGGRTLKASLASLSRLNYPDYEVILVDDGSTDNTPDIAAQFPNVRYVRQEHRGLSAARNLGIAEARGEVVAFTDADCRADEDWLHYLIGGLLDGKWAGIGGPNLLPPEDSWVAAAVLVSPGGPTHVMLSDQEAEHIPGCNMAFWKWALIEAGCFDPVFHRAGDDVDLCWRLQQRGHRLTFSPAAMVWHYRRSTVRDYLRQQRGYGEAEALLERKHPEYFNPLGGSIWRGRIYSPSQMGLVTRAPIIYHGLFASGMFQSLYTASPSLALMLLTSLEYHVLVTLPLLVLAAIFRWIVPLVLASLVLSAGICVAAAIQAEIPRKKRRMGSRLLVALLFALQPLARGWARYRGRLFLKQKPLTAYESLESISRKQKDVAPSEVHYLAPPGLHRQRLLDRILERLEQRGWQCRPDAGWSDFDVEIYGSRWSRLQITTVGEYSSDGRQLIRCRLRTSGTLLARVALASILGFLVLAIGLAGSHTRWNWLLLLLLPLVFGWLKSDQRDLRRLVGVFLDDVAAGLNLIKVAPRGENEGP